jgi:hypothetical protein
MSAVARQLVVKGQVNLDSYPTVKEFWELYETIKETRQKTKARIEAEERLSKREQKFLAIEHSKTKSKLNKLANMISGIQILDALEGTTELGVKDMQWEFFSKDSEEFNFKNLFDELILEAGCLENIPTFLLTEIKLLGSTEFYSKYSYLMGSTLSVRLENGTNKGLYFCIPFRAIKLGYLKMYLKKCTIVVPNFDHNMQRSSDTYSYEELEAMTAKYYDKASYIVEQAYLPA